MGPNIKRQTIHSTKEKGQKEKQRKQKN